MNTEMFSIAYWGVGGICSIAALLTAILFLLKKKTGKTLTLYGLCVVLLLTGGFLASKSNPFPQPLINEPEVDYTQSSRGPTPSYIKQIWDAAQPEPDPEYDPPVEDDAKDVIAPDPAVDSMTDSETSTDETDNAIEPNTEPSTAKISSSTPSRRPAQSTGGNTTPASAPTSGTDTDVPAEQDRPMTLDDNRTLAPEPELEPKPDRELVPEPYVAYTNPTLPDDPEPNTIYTYGNAPDSSQSGSGGNSGGNLSSGASSSGPYTHDFSNGRVLITTESNNNNNPVYHTWDCRAAKTIPPENSDYFNSAEEARNAGRRLCGYCDKS